MSELLLYGVRCLGLIAIVVISALLLASKEKNKTHYLVLSVCAGVFSYLLLGMTFLSTEARLRLDLGVFNIVLLTIFAVTPWFLLLLGRSLFGNQANIPIWSVFLLALQLGLAFTSISNNHWACQTANCMAVPQQSLRSWAFLVMALPTLIKLWFCFVAFIWTVSDWVLRKPISDLYWRLLFVLLLAIVGGGTVAAEDFALNLMVSLFPLVSSATAALMSLFFIGLALLLARPQERDKVFSTLLNKP